MPGKSKVFHHLHLPPHSESLRTCKTSFNLLTQQPLPAISSNKHDKLVAVARLSAPPLLFLVAGEGSIAEDRRRVDSQWVWLGSPADPRPAAPSSPGALSTLGQPKHLLHARRDEVWHQSLTASHQLPCPSRSPQGHQCQLQSWGASGSRSSVLPCPLFSAWFSFIHVFLLPAPLK